MKDYEAWLGIHDVHGRGDEKRKQVLNVTQLVYGPEGSDLVLLKLARLVPVDGFIYIYIYFFFFFLSFVLLGPQPQYMEVPRLGI